VLTGEHGVGVEKRDLMPAMFSEIDLNQQQRLKCAFDAEGLLNPGKVFPTLHRCAELGRMHVQRAKLPFPGYSRGSASTRGRYRSALRVASRTVLPDPYAGIPALMTGAPSERDR
jgi:hypothetical protein